MNLSWRTNLDKSLQCAGRYVGIFKIDEWKTTWKGWPMQVPKIHTNQRWNINKGSKDKTGASTLSHDKASNTMEQEAHHKAGLGETPRRLSRERCRYSALEEFAFSPDDIHNTWSSMIYNIIWDVVDTWLFTILQHPYCCIPFFCKFWCFSRFSVFYLVLTLQDTTEDRRRWVAVAAKASIRVSQRRLGVTGFDWLIEEWRYQHQFLGKTLTNRRVRRPASVVRRPSQTKRVARTSRERFDLESPNLTRTSTLTICTAQPKW